MYMNYRTGAAFIKSGEQYGFSPPAGVWLCNPPAEPANCCFLKTYFLINRTIKRTRHAPITPAMICPMRPPALIPRI